MGLLSPGGVHSHEDHIKEMIKVAASKGVKKIYMQEISKHMSKTLKNKNKTNEHI